MPLPRGVYAAAVTPRRLGTQDVNLGALWDLIDFLCERNVAGIALMCATGEFIHYSNSERMRLTGLAPKRSRVPILVNVSHSTLEGAVELAQSAADSGAAGVLLMPPWFFRYNEDVIRTFFLRFAEQSGLTIPTLFYNVPKFGNRVSPPLLAELIEAGAVAGVDDSSGDREFISQVSSHLHNREFYIFTGNDSLLDGPGQSVIHGVISGIACAVPELLVALERVSRSGTLASGVQLRRYLAQVIGAVDQFPAPVAIREALCLRKMKPGLHAVPFSVEGEDAIRQFREWFPAWLKEVLGECRSA
jgi:dihydrodipicolinate synthase/N-acetylneuraminate lyase